MPTTYSLDDSITTFLSAQTDTTREECDLLARSLLSDHVRLAQFRDARSPLDVEVLQRARSVYGPLVADTTYYGQIGQDRPLSVYIIEKLPGITYLEYQLASGLVQRLDEQQYNNQQTLIAGFARFFAASWKTPQAANTATIRQTFEDNLHLLTRTLPSRFSRDILAVLDGLDSIFESLPTVLSHGDLCEMNFLVDEGSGQLTGVIDWAEAEVLPFGVNLWGLENILGYMDSCGWHYLDQHVDLRALFRRAFHSAVAEDEALLQKQGAIGLARQMGILFRYAFRWDENLQQHVVKEGDVGMRYLDALFL